MPETGKRQPFRAEPFSIGHYREYPTPGHVIQYSLHELFASNASLSLAMAVPVKGLEQFP